MNLSFQYPRPAIVDDEPGLSPNRIDELSLVVQTLFARSERFPSLLIDFSRLHRLPSAESADRSARVYGPPPGIRGPQTQRGARSNTNRNALDTQIRNSVQSSTWPTGWIHGLIWW